MNEDDLIRWIMEDAGSAGGNDLLGWIIIMLIAAAVLGFIVKVAFWIWVANAAYQVYNAQVEQELRRLAMAVHHHRQAEAQAIESQMRQQVAALPRRERAVYRRKLSDVVKRKTVLNPVSGEWEEA